MLLPNGTSILNGFKECWLADTGPGSLTDLVPIVPYLGEMPEQYAAPFVCFNDYKESQANTELPVWAEIIVALEVRVALGPESGQPIASRIEDVFYFDPLIGCPFTVDNVEIASLMQRTRVVEQLKDRDQNNQIVTRIAFGWLMVASIYTKFGQGIVSLGGS